MPYRKRSSQVITKAERRAASMRSINPTLNLGDGLTLQAYTSSIDLARQKLADYNTMLSNLSQLYDEMIAAEQQVADLHVRMLSGVLTKYGRNSIEYEMAGGKRTKSKRTPAIGSSTTSTTTSTTTGAIPTESISAPNGSQNGGSSSNGATSAVY